MKYYEVYTDGSFLMGSDTVHGGIVFVSPDTRKIASTVHVQTKVPAFTAMNNVGGEVLAAWAAIMSVVSAVKAANEECMDTYTLTLVYDLQGVGAWITGKWKRNKQATKWFHDSVHKMMSEVPNLQLNLIWVKGHQDTYFNEIADAVANYDLSRRRAGAPICDLDETLREEHGFV